MKRAKTILIWILGILFIATGLSKLIHIDTVSEDMFTKAEFPYWLFYAAAISELAGGCLLLYGKTRRLGAVVIIAVMLGAITLHTVLHDNLIHIVVPALIIVFAGSLVIKK